MYLVPFPDKKEILDVPGKYYIILKLSSCH